MSGLGRRSTAQDVVRRIDLQGKVIVITGATSGIGVEIARALAAAGAELVLPARDVERGSTIADELITDTGNAKIRTYQLNLADFDSVRRFADNLMNDYPRVDTLIYNAGITAQPFGQCQQGYELHFSVNHLGHFLLTACLAPALTAYPGCRVICVSAAAHGLSPVVFDDIHFNHRPYDKWLAYGQSKTANALFAKALNQRLALSGGLAVAVNPGFVMSNLHRDLVRDEMVAGGHPEADAGSVKSTAQGAAVCVWAAVTEDLTNLGGSYCEDFRVATPANARGVSRGVHLHACDPIAAERLWDLSEHLVDCQFSVGRRQALGLGARSTTALASVAAK